MHHHLAVHEEGRKEGWPVMKAVTIGEELLTINKQPLQLSPYRKKSKLLED